MIIKSPFRSPLAALAITLITLGAFIIVCAAILMIAYAVHAQEAQEPPDCSGDRCVQFGVRVTPSDIAIHTMYGWCMLHQPVMGPVDPNDPSKGVKVVDNADWWPNPCNEVQAKFRDSGAQAKYEEIEKRDKANQLDMVKRGLGK